MSLVHPGSLAATVDAVSAAHFSGDPIAAADAREVALWIAGRQGLPGSYAGTFAPTTRDWGGVRLFTGEKVVTRAGLSHVLGEEACRALRLLGRGDAVVSRGLERANAAMLEQLHRYAGLDRGEFCCATCSVAVWRHLTAGGLDSQEARLVDGVRRLRERARGDGTWFRFPFYYTLLALVDFPGGIARGVLRHAAPRCERLLARRAGGGSVVARRRRVLLERVLDLVAT